jgi:RNA polymerase sigma factor (TIGR02999 family)
MSMKRVTPLRRPEESLFYGPGISDSGKNVKVSLPTCLVDQEHAQQWDNRRHFFAAAAEAMRRILVERARSRGRLKRGGDRLRLELLDQAHSLTEDPDLLLSLDELLTRLGAEDADAARVAHLHLFGGLSVEEAGDVAGLSRPVAYRNWKYARAWLREALEK